MLVRMRERAVELLNVFIKFKMMFVNVVDEYNVLLNDVDVV